MIKNCPKCNLINPPDAQHCDCGYSFTAEQVENSYRELKRNVIAKRGMIENRILLIALIVFAFMGLIPPWQNRSGDFIEYSFIILPPSSTAHIAVSHLFVQWIFLATITGGAIYLFRKNTDLQNILKNTESEFESESPAEEPKTAPLPSKQKTTSAFSSIDNKFIDETITVRVRPWVRFWARMFDLLFFSVITSFISFIFLPILYNMSEIYFSMLILFVWVFVESILLSTWGTTPGKLFLKIRLKTSEGKKPTFSTAIERSFSVWWSGLGIGFPIVSLFTLSYAHKKLLKDGITSWDRDGGFVVTHMRIGLIRAFIIILFFAGVLFSKGFSQALLR
jgi:uncharacterized RDD family membrane protein YckC